VVVTQRAPTEAEWEDMRFAMIVAKHTKSNAVTIAKNGQIVGVGAGQMSRIDSTRIAVSKARANHFELRGCVAASDAFLPFDDTLVELAEAGVTVLGQPGGSVTTNRSSSRPTSGTWRWCLRVCGISSIRADAGREKN